jgi:hypothetical protein
VDGAGGFVGVEIGWTKLQGGVSFKLGCIVFAGFSMGLLV